MNIEQTPRNASATAAAESLSRFDTISMSRFHRWVLILVSLGEFVDGYDLIVMGGALLFLVPEFHLAPAQVGLLGAAAFLGAALGAGLIGNMSDKVGRRTIFMFNLIFFVGFAILSSLVNNVAELFATRFLVGVAVGADIPTSMAFLAEMTPKAKRGAWTGFLPNITWTSGALTSVVVAVFLLHSAGLNAWRWMFGLAAIPALVVLLGRQLVPESPRWLLNQGRADEAQKVLQRFGLDTVNLEGHQRIKSRWMELFATPWRTRTISLVVINWIQALSSGVATIAAPFVLHYVGLISVLDSLLFTGLIWVVALLGTILGARLVDRLGRRRLAIWGSYIPMALSGVLLGLFGQGRPDVLVPLYLIYSFANWVSVGIIFAWAVELVPTRIRGSMSGLANVFARGALAVTIFIIPVGIATVGFGPTVATLAALFFINAAIVWRFPFFETAGQSLESIASEARSDDDEVGASRAPGEQQPSMP